jgi:hypothetical protein
MSGRKRVPQEGSLLVFLALALFALVAMGALAVDSALLYTAKTQHQLTANTAALAALEAYFDTADGVGNAVQVLQPKIDAAAARASQVTGASVNAQLAANLFENPSDSQSSYVTSYTDAPQSGDIGTLIPGRYFYSVPNSGCQAYCTSHPDECSTATSCPCGGADSIADRSPCFAAGAQASRANAMRIELKTNPDSKIRLLLGSIFGFQSAGVSVRATATLVPRRAVFLIDMSRSVTSDSHAFVGAQRDTYALFRNPEAESLTPGSQICNGANGAEPEGDDYTAWTETFVTSQGNVRPQLALADHQTFNWMSTNQPAKIAQYDCMTVPATGDEGNADGIAATDWETQVYLTDQGRTPQPLQSILQGIHVALRRFQERAVRGDMVAVLGFDDSILPSRATLSEPYSGIGDSFRVGLVRPDSQEFSNMLNAVDVPYGTNAGRPLRERLQFKFMIPRLYGEISSSGQRTGAGTDLAGALAAARAIIMTGRTWPETNNQFNLSDIDPEYERADNFVMLFTDGQGTCYRPIDNKDPRCITTAGAALDAAFNASIIDAHEELTTLKNAKIATYISLTGKNVAPNTVVRKDGNKCMTQERHSQLYTKACAGEFGNIGNVNGKNYFCWWWYTEYLLGSTPGNPDNTYGYKSGVPNGMYNTIAGYGAFLPLRDPCNWNNGSVASEAACQAGGLTKLLDQRCSSAAKDKYPVPNIKIGAVTYTNGDGAMFCDPLCRSKARQVEDYISQIMGQNPFVLVE